MKYKTTHDPFHAILKIVLGVVFGVMLLAISYKTVTTSREIRSRAAGMQDITYKSWEFNGATTEGWIQTNLTGLKVANGLLTAFTTNYNAILFNKSVAAAMPVGNKYLKFRLAVVNLPQPMPKPIAARAIVSTIPSPQPQTFTIGVSYMIRGALQQKVLPVIVGTAFGNMYEYSVRLPDIGGVTIDSIQMTLKPMRVGRSIQLDWVRLVGPPSPTPTPSGCNQDCNYTVHPARTCQTGLICVSQSQLLGASGLCRNPDCSNETSCQCPKPTPPPTPVQRCTSDKDCPTGYICSAVPPGGCPIIIVNGIEQRSACARVPQCWAVNPTPTPTPSRFN
ncbi:MAG: hypothetical protein NT149_01960 [Candidatus Gottesmanbacteria bacterium]|nr:hypothetical protein [Candidatus Gottesmanbacteria bacterium]